MVLVTGAAGLLGDALLRTLLAQGETVRALYNRKPVMLQHPLLNHFHADILDPTAIDEALQGVSEIYHCAGMVSFSPADARQLYKVNVEGTANVINAALDAGVKRLVHVSSVAALGRIREGEEINESMTWTPETGNSKYGHSKYLGEMEVWRGVAEGLEAVIVNPVIILGPGDWEEGSTKIFKSVYNESPWYAEGVTGFVDVQDVADAMIILMRSNVAGERYIISAENLSYKAVFDLAAKHFHKKPPHKKVTSIIAELVWRKEKLFSFFTGKKPLITRETASTALGKAFFNNSKFLKAFPAFNYRVMDETISNTCAALQQKINSR